MTRTGRIWPGAMTSIMFSTGVWGSSMDIIGMIHGIITMDIWSWGAGTRDGDGMRMVRRRRAGAVHRVVVPAAYMRAGVWVLMGGRRSVRRRVLLRRGLRGPGG